MAYLMGYYEATMMGEDGNMTQEPGKSNQTEHGA